MDKNTLLYLCNQAMLSFDDDEFEEVLENINTILSSLEILDDLSDKDIEELEVVTDKACEFREDEIKDSLRRSLALSNTDLTEYGYFKINDKVVEDE